MRTNNPPHNALRHHVTGAIERGEKYAIAETPNFAIGDRVWYSGGWGTERAALCTIDGVGTKNGQAVYDNSFGRWGYAHQYRHATPESIERGRP